MQWSSSFNAHLILFFFVDGKEVIVISASRDSLDNILKSIDVIENEIEHNAKKQIEIDCNPNEGKAKQQPIYSVMDVDVQVQELSKEINNFSGNKEDNQYQHIRNSLQICTIALNDIPNENNESVTSAKREIQTQINQLQNNLENKLTENRQNGTIEKTDKIKLILNDMQKIKTRIDCYNGLHKDHIYKQIENSLNLNEQKLKELEPNINHDKLKQIVQESLNKIKQYYKILDEKSIKVTTDNSKDRHSISYDSYKQLEQVRNDMLEIKTEMENYNGSKRHDDFNRICANLMHCNERLDAIPDMDSNSIKASKEQYTKYVKELLKYFEEKTTKF